MSAFFPHSVTASCRLIGCLHLIPPVPFVLFYGRIIVYIRRYATVTELKNDLKSFIRYYNTSRAHQGLRDQFPDDVYQSFQREKLEADAA